MATNEHPDGILLDLIRYVLNITSIMGGLALVGVLLFILVTRAKPEPAVQEGEGQVAQAQTRPTATVLAPATEAPAPATQAPASVAADPELIAMGEELFKGQGACIACHTIEGVEGAIGAVAPNLTNIGVTAEERAVDAGVADAEAYIRESIVDPNAYIVPECPNGPCVAGIMPTTFGQTLSDEQIDALVQFLLEQKGS
ncbi:MAG: c-type cytochrome [Anaerolineae bacterium]